MKTIKKYIAAITFCCFLFTGCDLTGLNDNPNKPTDEVDYNLNDSRLASLLRGGYIMEGDNEQRIKSLQLDFYSQMLIDGGGWGTKNYLMNEEWNIRMWEAGQTNIASLNIVIRNLLEKKEKGEEFPNTIAMAKIWRVFIHSRNVDYFGPVPFATYKLVEDNPPYKSVKDTYNEFFRELDEAVEMFNKKHSNGIFIDSSYDIVYKGNIDKWIRFAQSLRLRLALRVSEADPDLCREEAGKAIAGGVMIDHTDNAYLPPKADGGWGVDYNYTMFQVTWGGPLNMSRSFERLVTDLGGIDWPEGVVNKNPTISGKAPLPVSNVHPAKVDPRGPIMFQPARENGDWKGVPYGAESSQANNGPYVSKENAELGILIQDGTVYKSRPYDVFLYEEVCFLKAEAIARGFLTGDAKTEYENGVRASFETWGVSFYVDDYLNSTVKNYAGTSANWEDQTGDGNTVLEKIITQKYLAAFPDNSFEAWNDKRRLNLPRMDVAIYRDPSNYDNNNTDIKNPKNFIKRVQYPYKEQTVNKTEYDKGLQLLGGTDVTSTPIWWDKNSNYCTSNQ